MSLDWRKFTFFSSVPAAHLPSIESGQCALASAKGLLFIGEKSGAIHLLNSSYQSNLYRAHEGQVFQIYASPSKDIFVSVGLDDNQHFLKIWTYDEKFAEDGSNPPKCVHNRQLKAQDFLGDVSALAVNQALTFAAVGFTGGKVLLLRGDILREKHSKISQLHSSDYPVTNVLFHLESLYVVTVKDSQIYDMKERNPGRKHIDEKGCAPNCSTVSSNGELVIGSADQVLVYNVVEKTNHSHPVTGEKFKLMTFGRYLVVLTKDHGSSTGENLFRITIFSLQDRLSVYTSVYPDIHTICMEWTSICILSGNEELELIRLIECDVDQKLETLFQRNHFDVAKSICHEQGFGEGGLADVNKRWADYLFEKGDLIQAAEKYIQTLGRLEPSYVLHKLLEAQRLPALTIYLEALLEYNSANNVITGAAEHRNLLITCYAKSKEEQKLKQMLERCAPVAGDTMDNALEVLFQAGFTEVALNFAKAAGNHDLTLRIMMERDQNPSAALEYLKTLTIPIRLSYFQKFGPYFVSNVQNDFLEAMKAIVECKEVTIVSLTQSAPPRRVQFDDDGEDKDVTSEVKVEVLLDILEEKSQLLMEFTEFCLSHSKCRHLSTLWQRLMETQLRQWSKDDEGNILEKKLLGLLDHSQLDYKQALVYCRQFNFTPGLIKLLSSGPVANLSDLTTVFLEAGLHRRALEICGRNDPDLWRKVIIHWAGRCDQKEILDILEEAIPLASKMIHLTSIINMLKDSSAPISFLKPLILKQLEEDEHEIERAKESILKLSSAIKKNKEKKKNLLEQATVFKLSKCKLCAQDLSLPSVHFLCGHSFHRHCFTTYIDQDADCPLCAQQNRQLLSKLNLSGKEISDDQFLSQVSRSADSFGTIIDMLARGEIITNRKKTKPVEENFAESKPVSNKLLANRARIANELKFGKTPETPKSFNQSPKIPVKAILETPPFELAQKGKQNPQSDFDLPKASAAPNPFADNPIDSNPFGESEKTEGFSEEDHEADGANPFGAHDVGNPFGEQESDLSGDGNPFGDDDEEVDDTNPFK